MFGVIDQQYKMKINKKTGNYICPICKLEHEFYGEAKECAHKPVKSQHKKKMVNEEQKEIGEKKYEGKFFELRFGMYVHCLDVKNDVFAIFDVVNLNSLYVQTNQEWNWTVVKGEEITKEEYTKVIQDVIKKIESIIPE